MHPFPFSTLLVFLLYLALHVRSTNTGTAAEAAVHDFFGHKAPAVPESAHTNNWAVLVCASRYWFNYRVRRTSLLSAHLMAQF
jgi:phosphatidylinositol glycan class K